MTKIVLFLAGAFLANGIPHFSHGISGENFHNPFLQRYLPKIPSYLFNVLWGLLSFGLGIFLLCAARNWAAGANGDTFALAFGFAFAAVGLSLFFGAGGWREKQ